MLDGNPTDFVTTTDEITLPRGKAGLLQLARDLDREFKRNKNDEDVYLTEVKNTEFEWMFSTVLNTYPCGSQGCAMGYLALKYMPNALAQVKELGDLWCLDHEVVKEHFGIDEFLYRGLFYSFAFYELCPGKRVTPKMVAKAIQKVCEEPEFQWRFRD